MSRDVRGVNGMSGDLNLRAFNVAFGSIPTAPTKSPVESVAFATREPQIEV
jgi:hypothetical protein